MNRNRLNPYTATPSAPKSHRARVRFLTTPEFVMNYKMQPRPEFHARSCNHARLWLCRAARPSPGVHMWRRGLSPPTPSPSLSVVKEHNLGKPA